MKEQIMQLFNEKVKDGNRFFIVPELKVRRTKDILYISEINRTKDIYRAVVEVGTCGDKISIPLGLLDDLSLKGILLRLKGTGEKLLQIEKIR
jgi:hypothetical protein